MSKLIIFEIDNENSFKKSKYKGDFIKIKNKYNFIISLILLIIFVIYNLLGITGLDKLNYIFILLVLIRVLSRLLEIFFAFYDDAIDRRDKSSNIISNERVKLEVFSFIEIIILCSIIYIQYHVLLLTVLAIV